MVQIVDYTPSAPPDTDDDDYDILIDTYSNIPLTALSPRTCDQLRILNTKKILRSEEGYERDWRGIVTLAQQRSYYDEKDMCNIADPMARVIELWCKHNPESATFESLENFLGQIDRWDVSDDIYENLVEDAQNYRKSLQQKKSVISYTKTEQSITKPSTTEQSATEQSATEQSAAEQSATEQLKINEISDDFGYGTDANLLTVDDMKNALQGLPPQRYDAFVLFAEPDTDHAKEILIKLETLNFKLCLQNRDLLAGVSFAHLALTQLIEERCRHLIVIMTNNLSKIPEHRFLINYAQAIQIQHNTRKIIPLIYDDTVAIPTSIKIFAALKYYDTHSLCDFWNKLAFSIRTVSSPCKETLPLVNASTSFVETAQQLNVEDTDIPNQNSDNNPMIPKNLRKKKKERKGLLKLWH